MFLALAAVRSSSSFTRLRTGLSWRCTYFLRAKGFILPQNPCRMSGSSGCRAVIFWSELALWLEELEDDDDCELLCDEVAEGCWSSAGACWAIAGNIRLAANGKANRIRVFIIKPPESLAQGATHAGRASQAQLLPCAAAVAPDTMQPRAPTQFLLQVGCQT